MEEEISLEQEQVEQPPPRPVGTFYLRFQDEQSFLQAAEEAGFVFANPTEWEEKETQITEIGPDGQEEIVEKKENVPVAWEKVLQKDAFGYSIDVVGLITRGGQWETGSDGEVVETEAPVTLEGWHVNYSGILPKSFEIALIERPNSPHRIMR